MLGSAKAPKWRPNVIASEGSGPSQEGLYVAPKLYVMNVFSDFCET